MANIGEPVKKHEVIPLNEPVQPTAPEWEPTAPIHTPPQKIPEPEHV